MTETFYDRLGVSADATTEEIESAYREAVKRVHPDVSDEVDAGERTKRLNEAKRVLTDDDERARYDRLGHAAYTGEGPNGTESGGAASGGNEAAATDSSGPAGDTSADRTTGRRRGSRRSRGSASTSSERGQRGQSRNTGGGATGGGTTGRDTTDGESTWGGSQQRGRRGGRRRAAGPGGPGHRDESREQRSRAQADGGAATGGVSGRRRREADGTTRSRADSTGPSWQSGGSQSGGAATGSPSAQRQAAAGSSDGPNVDWSWNAWASTGAWAVRKGSQGGGFGLGRLHPSEQSVLLVGSVFFLYPFFVGTMLFPPFPLAARATVAVCTLLTFAYLLSVPEAAIAVFGLWSVLTPVILLAVPAVSLFSLVGVVALVATWVPLGLSVLTFSLVRP